MRSSFFPFGDICLQYLVAVKQPTQKHKFAAPFPFTTDESHVRAQDASSKNNHATHLQPSFFSSL